VNKGQFDFETYSRYVEMGMKALKNINKAAWYPFQEMTDNMKKMDVCGLGHSGLADALIMMGMFYDSPDTLCFLDEISKPYVEITNAIGGDSFYKRSQAPDGSRSIIMDCSAGIEPIFGRDFERHLTVGVIHEVRDLYKSKYCQTAHEICPEAHLDVQAKVQSFTDAGVSKTINLPEDASIDDVRSIYISAWKKDCKGVTVFRDGCKEGVLKNVAPKCEDGECYL
jgi:ribonucleoside-diphosphate reductase alpha chain